MQNPVEKLLSICSHEISSVRTSKIFASINNPLLLDELFSVLNSKNGFYGFESALHVFPYDTNGKQMDIVQWNDYNLWIDYYEGMASGATYFAEDLFGVQFCIKDDGIYSFNPETGSFEWLSENIKQWCQLILNEYNFYTGYSLAHEWQLENGAIATGHRLVPKLPFVAGGEYKIDNLFLEESCKSMRRRSKFALQIKDIPDGGSISFSGGEEGY